MIWGEAWTELRAVLDVETCPFSKTPNSFIDSLPPAGDAPRDDGTPFAACTIMLALRLVPLVLSVGEFAAEDLLEIRGILVGVSLDKAAEVLRAAMGGPSFTSRAIGCKPPTEGEPAIVGSWWRRSDESDCFCIELTVCEVAREEPALVDPAFDVKEDCEDDFRLATR